ncbi:hypothetical protein C0389_06730 [bacterium]|nr:hypothetical protein [bacterium]
MPLANMKVYKLSYSFVSHILYLLLLFNNLHYSQNRNGDRIVLNRSLTKIIIDGKLNEESWMTADSLNQFIEYLPVEGRVPDVKTEFKLLYDDAYIYIGFTCFDKDVKLIRSIMGNKDSPIYNDDYIEVDIWPAQNPQVVYTMVVNPLNVQSDSYQGQLNVDFDWRSAVVINENNWTGEIALPIKSLRFSESEKQEWKFLIKRSYPRSDTKIFTFPRISLNNSSDYSQAAVLLINEKLGEIQKKYILTPYFISSQTGSRNEDKFNNQGIVGRIGIDKFEYLVSQNNVLTLALRPDFSTAELDVPVIDVNQKYAFNYPEKRAFFFEGFDIFQHTSPNVFYSRSLNSPLFIGKFVGQLSSLKYGIISAYDEATPFLLPFEETSISLNTEKKSFSTIFRSRYDFDENYIGAILTNRNCENGYNTVLGFDGYYKINENNSLSFSLLKSFTREITDSTLVIDNSTFTNHTAKFDGEKFSGNLYYFDYTFNVKNLLFVLDYSDISPEFRAENGFINHNNFRSLLFWIKPKIYFDNEILNKISLDVSYNREWNYGGITKLYDYYSQLSTNFGLQSNISISYSSNLERYNNVDYKKWSSSLSVSNSYLKYFKISFNYSYGREINYNDDIDPLGFSSSLRTNIKFIPFSFLGVQLSYNYYTLISSDKNTIIFKGETFSSTISYQMFEKLSMRTIIQKNTFSKILNLSLLVSYEPDSMDGIYLGYYSKYNGNPIYVESFRNIYLKIKYSF